MNINVTLIGQSIAFVVFVIFCMKFVWPPLINAIEERQKKIADGLAASERAEKDLEDARAKADDELKAAKTQAAELIEQAKKRAAALVEEETQRGNAEREKIIASGYAEVEAERSRVREELRKQVAVLAVAGAEKIIEREIDAQKQSDIVEKLVAEL
ncbi:MULTISPECIES: F0F1 ATP synthase subunit B [Gammaproteobacteria]|uniref:F0F1 ATP synthase subunit B n=1 Tax=Gammaproteobacteria TaxID=1236 RepID=UPI000DCFB9FE|nr:MULTISPECIES: F0F1 ATP synthase subunit B [Gammaproteobacteria]RTE86706.1 F0F1 ATP synthase subunit B [Aliidiomarina sp. B3213]TCZ90740.1 F0F1 ATP synthase subunit B [Lysobacter sp. N42]